MIGLLFMLPFIDGSSVAAPPPPPAAVAAPAPGPAAPPAPAPAPVPTHDGVPMPDLDITPVEIPVEDGHVMTTGKAEAEAAAQPREEDYHARLCAQLQEAKPWIDWGCQ